MRRLSVLGVLTILSVMGTACATDLQNPSTETRLMDLGAKALGQDFRIVFHLERDVRICGGTGDYFVGQVEMNNRDRILDKDGHVGLHDNWVKVDKFYTVKATELNAPYPYLSLMGSDSCLE